MGKPTKEEKIANQARFIKDQMQELLLKLDEVNQFAEASQLEAALKCYTSFSKKIIG